MELQFDKKGNIVRLKDMCEHVIGRNTWVEDSMH